MKVKGKDERFKVKRIYWVGKKYEDKDIEMGGDKKRKKKLLLKKKKDRIVIEGGDFNYKKKKEDVNKEIEMVVELKRGGRDINVEKEMENV